MIHAKMGDFKQLFFTFIISTFFQEISCEDENGLAGLIAASTVTGVLLIVVIIMSIMFAVWRDFYKRTQLQKGRIKIPRAILEQERTAKKARKEKIKRQFKEQINQKYSLKSSQNAMTDMEMQYMHRSRPQIPGSWRREIRHQNGYIVQDVPTIQRSDLSGNAQLQTNIITISENDPAIWQPGGTYDDNGNLHSHNVPFRARADKIDSGSISSVSAPSTLKAGDKIKYQKVKNNEDEEVEMIVDFVNDDVTGDTSENKEKATAF